MILEVDEVKTHLRIEDDEEDDYIENLIKQAQAAAEDFCRVSFEDDTAPEPVRRGRYVYDYDGLRISNIRWEDAPDGEVLLYALPEAGKPYVLGASIGTYITEVTPDMKLFSLISKADQIMYEQKKRKRNSRYLRRE